MGGPKKLTSDDVIQIGIELTLGQPLSIKGREAKRMRAILKKQLADMRRKGIQPDWPTN